ncbi:MAG TPA: GDSL-type esterase/lipase family protein [Vicinamibacterales bacterium]|nr:GDSL-type esterase/lipase family protein [Vicinamibacterales bacterium]
MGLPRLRYLAATALTFSLACGGKGNGPVDPTPQPSAPAIACPADLTVREVRGAVQAVTYPAPTVSGGAAPVTVNCSPGSGSDFRLGATAVACSATDAQARAATCSFTVTLTGFALGAAKFLAAGDSLTEGENGRIRILDIPNAYPTKLQEALDAAYPGQNLRVINRGISGWPIERTAEELPGELAADRPDAVLLLSGYNNLLNECGRGPVNTTDCGAAINAIGDGVREVIRKSREWRVSYVFVSTLTPPGPVGPGSKDRRISNDAIVETNVRIRQIVAGNAATLVDVYPLFLGHEADYIEADGLHLRPGGSQVVAEAFFAAIQNTVKQTPLDR